MRRSAQFLIGALLLGGLTAGFGAAMPMTHASSATLPAVTGVQKVVQSGWYWYKQADAAAGTGVETAPEPSGVPKDDMAVAYTGGTQDDRDQPSKETYLAFDLSGVPAGASISAFSFTIALDKKTAQLQRSAPSLIACLPERTWSNGPSQPWVEKPSEDCSSTIAAVGTANTKAGTYTFSIPAIAQRWISDVNTGVAIRHKPGTGSASTPPFQLNFAAPTSVTAALVYEPPVVSTPTDPSTVAPNPTEQVPPIDTSGTGSLTGGVGGAPSVDTGGVAAPSLAPSPQLAPTPLASGRHVAPAASLPPVGFWLIGVLVLAALVLVSLVVGDAGGVDLAGAPTGQGRGSRLDRVLRARRTALTLETR
ncbi:MAG: hypothetical protein QOG53_448 [Frankiales bacterium]|jgi:hypothetical protein|nr:hypothetical protein [Frankiales bacterium]